MNPGKLLMQELYSIDRARLSLAYITSCILIRKYSTWSTEKSLKLLHIPELNVRAAKKKFLL